MTDLQAALLRTVVRQAIALRPLTPWQRAYIGRVLRELGAPVWPK